MHFHKRSALLMLTAAALSLVFSACSAGDSKEVAEIREEMESLYGENRRIDEKTENEAAGETGNETASETGSEINSAIDSAYDDKLAVKCFNGTFVGKEENGVRSFKGIPYAKAPVGELRWKEPVEPEADDGIYEAYYFGKTPIQTESDSSKASFYEQGEDCPRLNVWTSDKTQSEGKAVMVFIHGGSYGWGGTSDPIFDGQNFVEEYDDIVLVTIGYRTGILGFVDFSSVDGGEDYKTSGNLGLLDQLCALKWIQNNIEAFGGDPANVTIFGESAGAGSISLLPIIDGSEGLFRRMIMESGSVALTYSREECQRFTEKLLKETGASTMEELKALSEDELKAVNEKINLYNNFPERDGIVLPENLYEAYEQGAAKNIDMLSGTNEDEARYWIGTVGGLPIYKLVIPVMFESNMKRVSDEDMKYVDEFLALQNEDKTWNLTEFYNDVMFRVPAILQSDYHYENGGRTYMYYWRFPSTIDNYGANHAVELSYVLNNLDETRYTGDPADELMAKRIQQAFVNFAKTGDPSTEEFEWPEYDTDTRKTLIFDTEMSVAENLLGEQRDAIIPLIKYNFNGCYTDLSLNVPIFYKYVAVLVIGIGCITGLVVFGIKKNKSRSKRKS